MLSGVHELPPELGKRRAACERALVAGAGSEVICGVVTLSVVGDGATSSSPLDSPAENASSCGASRACRATGVAAAEEALKSITLRTVAGTGTIAAHTSPTYVIFCMLYLCCLVLVGLMCYGVCFIMFLILFGLS